MIRETRKLDIFLRSALIICMSVSPGSVLKFCSVYVTVRVRFQYEFVFHATRDFLARFLYVRDSVAAVVSYTWNIRS